MKALKRAIQRSAARFGVYIDFLPPTADRIDHHIKGLISHFDVNCVLDVGAHRGEFGEVLRRNGYTGRIVSWEPVPENFAILRDRTANDPSWSIFNYALGAAEETKTINVAVGTECSSFLEFSDYGKQQFRQKAAVKDSLSVPVRRLDSVFEDVVKGIKAPRVFLKIDTQGFDRHVMEGAMGCIDHVAVLQSEIPVKSIYDGPLGFEDTIQFYRAFGFEVSGIFPVKTDSAYRLIEVDCVMVRSADNKHPVLRQESLAAT